MPEAQRMHQLVQDDRRLKTLICKTQPLSARHVEISPGDWEASETRLPYHFSVFLTDIIKRQFTK